MNESSKQAYTCAYSGYKWAWRSITYKTNVAHYLYMYNTSFNKIYIQTCYYHMKHQNMIKEHHDKTKHDYYVNSHAIDSWCTL